MISLTEQLLISSKPDQGCTYGCKGCRGNATKARIRLKHHDARFLLHLLVCVKSLRRAHTNTAFIQFYMVMVPPQRPRGATFLLFLLDRREDREIPFSTHTHAQTHTQHSCTHSNQPERRFAFIWLTRWNQREYFNTFIQLVSTSKI